MKFTFVLLTVVPPTLRYTIEHDSEHDKWMRDQIGCSAFFDETEIAFLRQ